MHGFQILANFHIWSLSYHPHFIFIVTGTRAIIHMHSNTLTEWGGQPQPSGIVFSTSPKSSTSAEPMLRRVIGCGPSIATSDINLWME